MAKRCMAVLLGVLFALAALPADAGTTRYNPQRAGHPLRIVAYVLHPVGVALDYAIFRPAWWLGTHEPLRTIFGVEVVIDDSAEVAKSVQRDFNESVPTPVEPLEPTTPDTSPQEVPAPDSQQ